MNRKLPEIELMGQVYIVDVECRALVLKEDKRRSIAFSNLADKGSHYSLRYNEAEKRMAYNGEHGKHVSNLQLPQMVKLDPEGIALMYSTTVEKLPERDSGLRQDPEILKQRQQGRQPTIKLVGHTFFVDLHWGLLRPKDDFMTLGINVNALPHDESGYKYAFLYDAKKHEVVAFDPEMTSIPKYMYALEVPEETFLDPYAVQRRYESENNTDFYNTYPIRYNMEARIIPWSETIIPELVKKNKAKLEKSKSATRQKKNGRRP